MSIREIKLSTVLNTVKQMCMNANYFLNDDVRCAINNARKLEKSNTGINILEQLIQNADIAKEKEVPICQDTGMAVLFVEVGQDVHIVNDLNKNKNINEGTLTEAINEGVRIGYEEGYLRKSVVTDPLIRKNSNNNLPAIIHYNYVSGNKIKIDLCPKGFGSENMSRIYMLKPSDGIEGVKKAILETIDEAGPNPCPPMVVGVGIGGDFEYSAIMAKKALLRPIGKHSEIEYIKELEIELVKKANSLGIGPAGLGGITTVLGININTFATHIAGLPLAINISCHATRHSSKVI